MGKHFDRYRKNADRTHNLVFISPEGKVHSQLIRATLKDIPPKPLSDERIDEIAQLDSFLKSRVFGIDEIVERISERMLSIENESTGASEQRVNVVVLNGLSQP